MRIETEVEVEVDIEIGEFDNDEVVDHICELIEDGSLTKKEINQIKDALKEEGEINFDIVSLDDQMKYDHIVSVFSKYTCAQVAQMLP